KEIIRNLPPSFLVTAYGDTLRNYSRQYAKAIKKAGVICHLEDYEVDKKLPHAFSTTFPEMEESKRANTQMVEFLFKY
ncbi:MAG: alpha/beta hydrolase, partial [Blautia massiliensis (ex Durand et al. 2017)]